MKKFLFILTVFFFAVNTSFSQYNFDSTKIRPEILKIVHKIAKINELQSETIGYSGTRSKQYKRYEKLRDRARKNELLELTGHSNAVVRCYAFWGLRDRQENDLFDLLLKHMADSATIITFEGCVKDYTKALDFCIKILTEKYLIDKEDYKLNSSCLNEDQQKILDSILIFSPNKLTYTSKLLMKIEPNPNFYYRIRELAKSGNISAVIALSKYQNEDDIVIILNSQYYKPEDFSVNNALYYTFAAMSFFPNTRFWDFLVEYSKGIMTQNSNQTERSTFYKAVAAFKTSDALKLLKSKTPNDIYYIFKAIEQYSEPIYDSLKFRIWEDRNIITRKSLDYLFTVDSIKTIQDILESLDNSRFLIQDYELDFSKLDNPQKVINKMLDTILFLNKQLGISIIARKITFSTREDLKVFTEKAAQLKDSTLLKELLSRIKNSIKDFKNDDYYYIMQAILTYENQATEETLYSEIIENTEVMITEFDNKSTKVREMINSIKEIIDWKKNHEDYNRVLDEINQ